MQDKIRQILNEELSKKDKEDVQSMIDKAIDSNDLEKVVIKLVKDRIKNEKELEDKVVDITKNVITQLFKTLWVKRNFWKTTLKNKST